MKAVVNEIEKKETDFPKLMVHENGDVVLFEGTEDGVLVASKSTPEDIGSYSECWNPRMFQDFKGSVTLSND